MEEFAIYTVCTGHYKYGLFALLKSLRKNNYTGTVVIATDKPFEELSHLSGVKQIVLNSKHIFGNLKARIILEHPAEKFLYLDPDIIQIHPDFVNFIFRELSLHQRIIVSAEGMVAKNEIRRWLWNKKMDIDTMPLTDIYYSAGLLAGIFREHRPILELWDKYIHQFIEPGKYFRACPEFPLADQDILNAVLQNIPEEKITGIGMPDWIGTATGISAFHESGHFESPLFVHSTGKLKTWLIKELPRRYPNLYDREFYKYYQDDMLNISSDLKFSWIQKKWFLQNRLLPLYNKLRKLFF